MLLEIQWGQNWLMGPQNIPPLDNWILCNTTTDIYMYKQFKKELPRTTTITKMNDNINMDSTIAAVSDLHVGLIG
jgi:hypothetical protein